MAATGPGTFKGISFPFSKGSTSFPKAATDADLIRQSIIQIILTARGERVHRPDFGSRVHDYVFENNDVNLEQLLQIEIVNVISKFEPRVILTGVTATRDDTTITLLIQYVIAATRAQDQTQIVLNTNAPA